MTRADLFAWGTLVISVLGLIGALYSGSIALAILSIILLITILIIVSTYTISRNLPPWTVMKNNSELIFEGEKGERAVVTKNLDLRANHGAIKHYIHRNISTDGNVKFSVDPNVKIINKEREAGDYVVTVEFPNHISRLRTANTWIKFHLENSFPADRESITINIDQPTRNLTVRVVFPKDRLPKTGTIKMIHRQSGSEKEVASLNLDDHSVAWFIKRRLFGIPNGEYVLFWQW